MSDLTLHELGDARDILDQRLAELEGELLPELETLLEDLDCAIDEKAERVGLYILDCEANAEACRVEAKRLLARAAAKANRADSLRDYLQRELVRLGKKSIDGDRLAISRQKNSVLTIKCDDAELADLQIRLETSDAYAVVNDAPILLKHTQTVIKLNRSEIERRFKMGEPLPPAIVVEHGEHVRIR